MSGNWIWTNTINIIIIVCNQEVSKIVEHTEPFTNYVSRNGPFATTEEGEATRINNTNIPIFRN